MHQVGAFEAKNTFGSLLDRAEAGEEILITRHGKPIARLVPNSVLTLEQRRAALGAIEKIRAMAKDSKSGPFDWEEWKAYRDEGRR
jgi:prevent-host-death family protein